MADNLDPDAINQLNQQLRDLTDAITSQSASMKQGSQAASTFTSALKSSSQKVTSGSEVLKKAGTDFNAQMKQYGQVYDRTTREWVSAKDKEMRLLNASQKAVYDELQAKRANILKEVQRNKMFSDELKSLGYSQDANGKLIKTSVELNDAQKKQIRELSKHEEKIRELQKRHDEFGETMKKNLGSLVKGFGSFASSLAKGDSSFASLNPIIDLVADALGSVAKLIPIFGDGIASGIKVGAEAAKLTMELLDKNLKMFQDISNMGGLVSNGMQGLQEQVIASGMSMEGFTKIVRENGTELAAFGGTVGLGANKFMGAIGEITKKGGKLEQSGIELRKLGLTADDVGEQAAAFLQQEIRLGRGREMTTERLQQGTIAYVKELDLLQKVTGLSREEIQKQRDTLMSDTRYRMAFEKTRQENGDAAAEAMNKFIMSVKDPELKRGIMDLASGVATTDEARKAIVTYGNTIPEILSRLKQVRKPEDTAKAFDESQQMMMKGAQRAVKQFGDVMMYGTDQLSSGATAQEYASGKYNVSMEKAKELQDKQIKDGDKLTDSTVKAQAEMDKMKNSMFEFSNTLMKNAAPAVEAFTKALNAGADFITKTFGTGTTKGGPSVSQATKQLEKQTTTAQTSADKVKELEKAGAPAKQIEEARKQAQTDEAAVAESIRQQREAALREANQRREKRKQENLRKMQGPGAAIKANEPMPDIGQLPTPGPSVKVAGPMQPPPKAPAPVTPTKPAAAPAPAAPAAGGQAELPKDVASLIKFQGDNLGNKTKYDALEPAVKENFEKMIAEYGKPVQVNAAMRDMEDQQKLYDAWIARGKTGNPVAPPGRSKHNYGRALDLNSPQVNEMESLGLLSKYGFSRVQGDPPHIEMARFGGMFDGPESGYPVMLHGREAVVPQQQLDSIKSVLEKVTKENLPSSITSPISNVQDESISILKELYTIMSEKLDNIVDKLADGNDTREELLQYSKA